MMSQKGPDRMDGKEPVDHGISRAVQAFKGLSEIEVARHILLGHRLPHIVCSGNEKTVQTFLGMLEESPRLIPKPLTASWCSKTMADVIVFNSARSAIRTMHPYAVQMLASYVVSVIADRFENQLNREMIWSRQRISESLTHVISAWAETIFTAINEQAASGSITEFSKTHMCWEHVRGKEFYFGDLRPPEIFV